jgi:hypothetical protein
MPFRRQLVEPFRSSDSASAPDSEPDCRNGMMTALTVIPPAHFSVVAVSIPEQLQ